MKHLPWTKFDQAKKIIAAGEESARASMGEIKKLVERNSYIIELEHFLKKIKG